MRLSAAFFIPRFPPFSCPIEDNMVRNQMPHPFASTYPGVHIFWVWLVKRTSIRAAMAYGDLVVMSTIRLMGVGHEQQKHCSCSRAWLRFRMCTNSVKNPVLWCSRAPMVEIQLYSGYLRNTFYLMKIGSREQPAK